MCRCGGPPEEGYWTRELPAEYRLLVQEVFGGRNSEAVLTRVADSLSHALELLQFMFETSVEHSDICVGVT